MLHSVTTRHASCITHASAASQTGWNFASRAHPANHGTACLPLVGACCVPAVDKSFGGTDLMCLERDRWVQMRGPVGTICTSLEENGEEEVGVEMMFLSEGSGDTLITGSGYFNHVSF